MSDERQRLLEPEENICRSAQQDEQLSQADGSSIHRTPLVAFLACFGMTAAAASSVFVFAHILCKDPAACDEHERGAFSGSLAIATTIANVCAIVAIQPLYSISKKRPKVVLLLWLVCRASSVAVLWVAASLKNINVVVFSKVLEGTATDNILQFALSTIYVRAKDGVELSSLMAESMAFTLFGSALGPLVASLGQNLQQRLLIALFSLSAATVYAMSVVNLSPEGSAAHKVRNTSSDTMTTNGTIDRLIRRFFSHLHVLLAEPVLLLPGLALLFYTMGQGYVLPALMVYASERFGFTDRQNSWLLSLAITISALYAFLARLLHRRIKSSSAQPLFNSVAAAIGMVALGASLPLVLRISSAEQMYLVVALMSLGITSSSFIKAFGFLQLESPQTATGAVAILETTGSLLSPVTLGLAQNKLPEGHWTLVSTTLMGVALLLFTIPLLGQFSRDAGRWLHAHRRTRT